MEPENVKYEHVYPLWSKREHVRGPTFIMFPSPPIRELRVPVRWVDVDEMLLFVASWPPVRDDHHDADGWSYQNPKEAQ